MKQRGRLKKRQIRQQRKEKQRLREGKDKTGLVNQFQSEQLPDGESDNESAESANVS